MSKTSALETCVRCGSDLGSQRFYIQYTVETSIGPICLDCYIELKRREVDGGKV